MISQHNLMASSSAATSSPRLVGRFVAGQALLWMLAAPVIGAVVARLAVWVQQFHSPLVLFPLLAGASLGLLLVGLMRLGQIGHRATLWSGALLAVAAAVVGQHYFSYRDWKAAETARIAEKLQALSLLGGEELISDASTKSTGFARFIQQGRPVTRNYTLYGAAAWASWALDGLLTLFAALTIIYLAVRTPYCHVCRTWYRTIRAGPLAADRARRMAETASLPTEEPLTAARYRLAHCVGGCGPARLELAGAPGTPGRGPGGTKTAEAWLSPAQRELVVRVLDGERTE